jgi:hypothetical protein
MYRPVVAQQKQQQGNSSVKSVFFSDKNYNTLQTVLIQDFQERNVNPLNEQQIQRLSKTLNHYMTEVYQVQGEKPIQILNKEALSNTAKDFSQYLQRKEITKNISPVKTVMDDTLFQETSTRFEKLTQERNEVKALPPSMPDFRIDFKEDGPPAAELFERAKKQREFEALRSAQQNAEKLASAPSWALGGTSAELIKADAGIQSRVAADSNFRNVQDTQNRNTELALFQRQQNMSQKPQIAPDLSLAIMPDRRDLLIAPIGSFDTMTMSPNPRELGQANSNPTIVNPILATPLKNDLPQNYVQREDKIVSYREIENNLFIYSADRDWLRNNKENRYSFTVNFDPAANGQSFNPTLSAQQKFKNIVRIELVKCIMAGESLDVTINKTASIPTGNTITTYQDNILNLPYVTVRVAELENNNYGTDNFLDRSFGVLQYDAQWVSDDTQKACTRGYLAMIPKFLKCQKEFYPTPLSTLQKMTIDIRRPNGELVSNSPDTFDISGIIGAGTSSYGAIFPFGVVSSGEYNLVDGPNNNPFNFYIVTNKYFSRFDICKGDRIQISGYTYSDAALNDPTYGSALRDFSNWINQPEGHIVLNTCYTPTPTTMLDGLNDVGYGNIIVIQARYQDPSTGSVLLNPFYTSNFANILNAFGAALQSPCRLIDLNKQLNLVFRVITREMDSLPQIRPDNNY